MGWVDAKRVDIAHLWQHNPRQLHYSNNLSKKEKQKNVAIGSCKTTCVVGGPPMRGLCQVNFILLVRVTLCCTEHLVIVYCVISVSVFQCSKYITTASAEIHPETAQFAKNEGRVKIRGGTRTDTACFLYPKNPPHVAGNVTKASNTGGCIFVF